MSEMTRLEAINEAIHLALHHEMALGLGRLHE